MISIDAIKNILGINEVVNLTTQNMVKDITITFYPHKDLSNTILNKFSEEFRQSLINIGVKIVPYNSIWQDVGLKKIITRFFKYNYNNLYYVFRKIIGLPQINFYLPQKTISKLCSSRRIKSGITIVCIGEQDINNLVMQYISSFKTNSVITIINMPDGIDKNSDFSKHFDTCMSLFAYHMTNIIIAVGHNHWLTYNFNASHPIYSYPDANLDMHILESIIPKIAAPITPHKLSDFKIDVNNFDPKDEFHVQAIDDMIEGSKMFIKTGLFPSGKSIDGLPFRDNLHKHIGKLHLDNRSGMSFGYFAYQLPTKIVNATPYSIFRELYGDVFLNKDYYINGSSELFIIHEDQYDKLVLQVPPVWVMTIKSGANKTNFNKSKDLIKIGLINGKMYLQLPKGLNIDNTYKPSFDTKVILAHAVGNALIASICNYRNLHDDFVNRIKKNGISMSHWHGYFNTKMKPNNIIMYGRNNPPVSCSSPQSAIYALQGKMIDVVSNIAFLDRYSGDIHIEPHHGINVSYSSLVDLAKYIISNPSCTSLGNKYL